MYPILFEIPAWDIKLHAYGVMILLACAGALAITAWRARREGLRVEAVYELATWLFLGGVIGARALFAIRHPEAIHGPLDLVRSWQGGNIFYGCIMGGLTGSLIYWWRRPFPFWPMADAVAPALAVGITFGRLGCFLNGCCFGEVCDLPFPLSIRYPAGSHAWFAQVEAGILAPAAAFSLPVHPTQLYAAGAGLVLLILLSLYYPRRRRDGSVMVLLMVLYPLSRWPIEMLRGDEQAIFAGMTLSQNISLGLLLLGLATGFRLSRRAEGRYADSARRRSEAPAAAMAANDQIQRSAAGGPAATAC
jgi:phosphatidylglycerol:prolipoprotein diacylglycerol transferase